MNALYLTMYCKALLSSTRLSYNNPHVHDTPYFLESAPSLKKAPLKSVPSKTTQQAKPPCDKVPPQMSTHQTLNEHPGGSLEEKW